MLSFNPIKMLDITEYRSKLTDIGSTFRCCDYTYANLLCWADIYDTHFAKCNDGYIFRISYKGKTKYLCPVTKKKNFGQILSILTEYEKACGQALVELICVPEDYARILKNQYDSTIIKETRNNFDYIYESEKLISYSGKSLHSKKNHKNKFMKLYSDVYRYKTMTPDDVRECIDFNNLWYEINSEYALGSERTATLNLLKNFEKLGLVGGMIYLDDRLCAYSLASDFFSGSDTLVVHTEKAMYDVEGIYPTICSEFVQHEGASYKYINREDDVGDEGLRKSKLSYKPCHLEKKFSCQINFNKEV